MFPARTNYAACAPEAAVPGSLYKGSAPVRMQTFFRMEKFGAHCLMARRAFSNSFFSFAYFRYRSGKDASRETI
jgi:hypothetical protein